ncbi:MAG: ATP synthase F0 subunit B [Candidatus Magasanikbacteria bacterium RIFOXYC2_FULL_39_8]|nr:MAG: ATP synthase F0 subunit B [Candidatus Magasanikbacteria bacterium RIFOXYC2_FULL_39_8]
MTQEVHTTENIVETQAEVTHGTTVADEGLAASLGLNGQLFAWQLLNFAVVAAIVWFLILKPLTSKLEERKKLIDDSLDKAKEIETNFETSEKKYQEKLDEAKAEANKVIEQAHAEGKQLGDSMKTQAKVEVEKLVEQAKKHIAAEKDTMFEDIKKEAASMIVLALEKVLGEKMDSEKDKKIIEESLRNLKK